MTMRRNRFAAAAWLRTVFRRGAVDREMQQEMTGHLEQAAERLMARGLTSAEARVAARREFGNIGVLQEEARDARGARWIETFLSDVRYALRHFSRMRLTAITLILVLALGIGVNAALFSILQTLTTRPAPAVSNDPSLVRVRGTTFSRTEGELRGREFSMLEVNDLASRRETFSTIAVYARQELMLDAGDGSDARALTGNFVSPNYFSTLGVRTVLGPGLPAVQARDVPGAELAAVISYTLWKRLGSDSAIIGRIVRVNDVPVRVAGVAPSGFQGAVFDSGIPHLFIPLSARATILQTTPTALANRDSTLFEAFGRLAPNVSLAQATAVVAVVAAAWAPEKREPGAPEIISGDVVRLRGLTDVGGDDVILMALLATGAILILLVACTNVSALLVGAAVARRREIAIRLSLGASRLRVVRQLITETALIALAGGGLGLTLYWWITRTIAWMYVETGIGPDFATVGFTALIALGTGIVFGLSPALHATGLDVASVLKNEGAGTTSRSRLQRVFIVAQIVLTQPLLVGIAMVIGVTMSELGPRVENPLNSHIVKAEFSSLGGAGTRDQKRARVAEVMKRIAEIPGVEAIVPQSRGFDVVDIRVHSSDRGAGRRAEEAVRMPIEGTPPGYFAFQNISMVRGRELIASDTLGTDMALIIDTKLARDFWGAVDPIGRRVQMASVDGKRTGLTTGIVVGVFDTTGAPLRGEGRVYTASGARWSRDAYLVRTRGPGSALIPEIRRLARASIPDIPIYSDGLATLEQLNREQRNVVMQVSGMATGGGMLALLLASIGLYGVVALAVRQRHREIGVRVALGARPGQVIATFFLSGVRLSALGVALGLPLSAVALNLIRSNFTGLLPVNLPLAGVAIAVAVIGVAALASYVPARRAARVDPLAAIRVD
jgi:predicted permease